MSNKIFKEGIENGQFVERLEQKPLPANTAQPVLDTYYNDTASYNASGQVTSFCNEITFVNSGTSGVTINGFPLLPGAQLAYDGKKGETDVTKYNIVFDNTALNLLWVFRKIYN